MREIKGEAGFPMWGLLAGHPKIIRAAASAVNSKRDKSPKTGLSEMVFAELWVRVGVAVREANCGSRDNAFRVIPFSTFGQRWNRRAAPLLRPLRATRFVRVDRHHGLHQTIRELNVQ